MSLSQMMLTELGLLKTQTLSEMQDLLTELGIIKTQSLSRAVTNSGGMVVATASTGVTVGGVTTINFPAATGQARIRQIILSVGSLGMDNWWRILLDGQIVWEGFFNMQSPVPYILRLGEFFLSGTQMQIQRMAGGTEARFTVWWEDLVDDSGAYRTTQADT